MKLISIPKIFWKYYDLYRRKQISIDEYQKLTGISKEELLEYLNEVQKETDYDLFSCLCYNKLKRRYQDGGF